MTENDVVVVVVVVVGDDEYTPYTPYSGLLYAIRLFKPNDACVIGTITNQPTNHTSPAQLPHHPYRTVLTLRNKKPKWDPAAGTS